MIKEITGILVFIGIVAAAMIYGFWGVIEERNACYEGKAAQAKLVKAALDCGGVYLTERNVEVAQAMGLDLNREKDNFVFVVFLLQTQGTRPWESCAAMRRVVHE